MVIVGLCVVLAGVVMGAAVVWGASHVAKTIRLASGFFGEVLGTEYDKAYVPFDELMEAFGERYDVFGEDELVLASDFEFEEDDDA